MGGGRDDHLANFAKLVVHNKGARITGAAGVGQIKLLEQTITGIEE